MRAGFGTSGQGIKVVAAAVALTVLCLVTLMAASEGDASVLESHESADFAEAQNERSIANIEIAKSDVVQKEADLDADKSRVSRLLKRLKRADSRVKTLKHEMSKQESRKNQLDDMRQSLLDAATTDDTTAGQYDREQHAHLRAAKADLASLPREKKRIAKKEALAKHYSNQAVHLQMKEGEVERKSAKQLSESISDAEHAQEQFALSKETATRSSAKKIEATQDAKKLIALKASVPPLSKEVLATALKYHQLAETEASEEDQKAALKLQLQALEQEIAALEKQSHIPAADALKAVETGAVLPADNKVVAKLQQQAAAPPAKAKTMAQAQERLRQQQQKQELSAQASLKSKLKRLSHEADEAARAASAYHAELAKDASSAPKA